MQGTSLTASFLAMIFSFGTVGCSGKSSNKSPPNDLPAGAPGSIGNTQSSISFENSPLQKAAIEGAPCETMQETGFLFGPCKVEEAEPGTALANAPCKGKSFGHHFFLNDKLGGVHIICSNENFNAIKYEFEFAKQRDISEYIFGLVLADPLRKKIHPVRIQVEPVIPGYGGDRLLVTCWDTLNTKSTESVPLPVTPGSEVCGSAKSGFSVKFVDAADFRKVNVSYETKTKDFSLVPLPNIRNSIFSPSEKAYQATAEILDISSAVNDPLKKSLTEFKKVGNKLLAIWWAPATAGGPEQFKGKMYDLTSKTWADVSPSNAPSKREYLQEIEFQGKWFVMGGTSSFATYAADGAIFDPVANSWEPIPMTGFAAPSSAGSNLNAYIKLGWTGEEIVHLDLLSSPAKGALYNPTTKSWRTMNMENAPSREHPAASFVGVLKGKFIYINAVVKQMKIFNPQTNSWSDGPPPPPMLGTDAMAFEDEKAFHFPNLGINKGRKPAA